MKNRVKANVNLGDLAALWVVCWTFIPFMQVGSIYRVVSVLCAGFWLLLHIKTIMHRYCNFVFIETVAVLLQVLLIYMLSGSASDAVSRSLQYMIVIIVALMTFYYFDYRYDAVMKVLPLILILIILFSITTMKGTMENPYAARIANSEWLENRFKGNEMVGLFGFVYMCVFIEPLLLYAILHRLNFGRITNLLIRIAFVSCFLMIITAGYMIAIFLLLIGCAMVWAANHKSMIKTTLIIMTMAIFMLFYRTIIDKVFLLLMGFTEGNPVYYNKFNDFRMLFIDGSASGETVYGRFKNYAASLNTMISYPIIGSYFFGVAGGGGHSALLDYFGKFGWFVGGIFSYTYFCIPHKIAAKYSKWMILDYVVLLMTTVFCFADPAFQEMGVAIFLLFPLFKRISQEQCKKGNI